MNETKIMSLLESVKEIVAQYKAENYRNGKEFNIFYIQRTSSDEKRVCRFIRELLDPNGSHGQGILFLRRFVKDVLTDEGYVFDDAELLYSKVVCEEIIDDSRRIDIVLYIGDRVIPFEVKIYADDQPKQCYDYYHYVVKKDTRTKIYYLTLDGHAPTEDSINNLDESHIKCLSFSEHIIKWIQNCINLDEIITIAPVREVLFQFLNVIMDLTGKQEGKLEMQIKEQIETSYENIIAAVEIEKALPEVKIDKMIEIFKDIALYMESKGFKDKSIDLFTEEAKLFYRNNKKSWPSLNYVINTDNDLNGKLVLRFEIDHRLYFGISPWDGQKNSGLKKSDYAIDYVAKSLTPDDLIIDGINESWYWWKHLNKDVNFRYCNAEYYNLYNKEYYNTFMNDVKKIINSFIDRIN